MGQPLHRSPHLGGLREPMPDLVDLPCLPTIGYMPQGDEDGEEYIDGSDFPSRAMDNLTVIPSPELLSPLELAELDGAQARIAPALQPQGARLIPRSEYVRRYQIKFRQGYTKNSTGRLCAGAPLDWRTGPTMIPADADPTDYFTPYKVLLLDLVQEESTQARNAILRVSVGAGGGNAERKIILGGRPVALKLGHYIDLNVEIISITLPGGHGAGVTATWTNEEVQLDTSHQLLPAPLQTFAAPIANRSTPKGAVTVKTQNAVTLTWHTATEAAAADFVDVLAAGATVDVKAATFDVSAATRLQFWLRPL